jgi:DNA polymerase elongation subunit (family B)
MIKPKILLYDIETTPSGGWFWGGRKHDQNILKVTKEREILSVAWKWYGESSIQHNTRQGESSDKRLTKFIGGLLNEADISIAYNGDNFDIKVARTRMIYHYPDCPIKRQTTVDPCKVARSSFSFTGNSLSDLVTFFNLGEKTATPGLSMWLGCMSDDEASWKRMIKYNRNDVVLLTKVYRILRPWIENHPNVRRLTDPRAGDGTCPVCSSLKAHKRGFKATSRFVQQQWNCQACGHWFLTAVKK